MTPFRYSSQNRKGPAKQLGGKAEIPDLNRGTDQGTADDLPFDCHRLHAADRKTKPGRQIFQQRDGPGPVDPKGPILTHTDLDKSVCAGHEPLNKDLGPRLGEFGSEILDQEGVYSQAADELGLMLRRCQQTRRLLRPKNLYRVWMKREDHRAAAAGVGSNDRFLDDRAMAKVNSVEYSDCQMDRTGNGSQTINGADDLHFENSSATHPGEVWQRKNFAGQALFGERL